MATTAKHASKYMAPLDWLSKVCRHDAPCATKPMSANGMSPVVRCLECRGLWVGGDGGGCEGDGGD